MRSGKTYHDKVTQDLYEQFSPESRSQFSIAKIDPAPHTWHMISFFPTPLEGRLPGILADLSRKHKLNIEGRVLHDLDEYCQVYHSSLKERDAVSGKFLDYVLSRDVFSAKKKPYVDVEFYERGNKVSVVDIVQNDVIAQVNVMSGNARTLHKKLACKRRKLREVHDYCRRYGYGCPKLVIIKGHVVAGGWQIELEQVSHSYADGRTQVLNK